MQEAESKKWLPWPEAHAADLTLHAGLSDEELDKARTFSRRRLDSEAEAAECWRTAVNMPKGQVGYLSTCFLRKQMEEAGLA